MQFELFCQNCGNLGPPDKHGRCSSCGSDAIADVLEPRPLRDSRPTGIERMFQSE